MGRTSSKGFLSLVLPGLVVIALLAVVVRAGVFRHSLGSAHPVSLAAETMSVQQQMAKAVRGWERPKTLAALRCNRTFTAPLGLDRFDCYATFTSGERQPWCAVYDAPEASLVTYYKAPKACESPPPP